MVKMPCLFVRIFPPDKRKDRPVLTEEVTPGCEWVLSGEWINTASIKRDGSACRILWDNKNDKLAMWKRYDLKRDKPAPENWEPCQPEKDPITGHWPGWLPVVEGDPSSKWHLDALNNTLRVLEGVRGSGFTLASGTYEACGPQFQTNPEKLTENTLIRHGIEKVGDKEISGAGITFDSLREFLRTFGHEGLVFAHPDGRFAKIRRSDYGFSWPHEGGCPMSPKHTTPQNICTCGFNTQQLNSVMS